MDKSNIFRSSPFYLFEGDILHIVIKDESGTPPTINLIETSKGAVEAGTPIPTIMGITTSELSNSFVLQWATSPLATGYYLDIATDSSFTTKVTGYDNKDIGNMLTYKVTGLPTANNTYYCRIRAYNAIGVSSNSNTILAHTIVYDDWFLPSVDEMYEMYSQLYLHGLGQFTADATGYWTSNGFFTSDVAYCNSFITGVKTNAGQKSSLRHIRPCRSFVGDIGLYNIRDKGKTGGYIFAYTGGKYYESAPNDLADGIWSNVNILYEGNKAIGGGITNTLQIIAQAGHTSSAAQTCDALVI